MPRECGFKIEQPGGRASKHYATKEEEAAQCLDYAHYKKWAFNACCLAEEEVKEHLSKAAGLHRDILGKGDLPKAFQRDHHHVAQHGEGCLSHRDHATLLCRRGSARLQAVAMWAGLPK